MHSNIIITQVYNNRAYLKYEDTVFLNPLDSNKINIFKDLLIIPTEDIQKKITPALREKCPH